jgi:hypothetical protein
LKLNQLVLGRVAELKSKGKGQEEQEEEPSLADDKIDALLQSN